MGYTLSAGKLPNNKDFVDYFLYENKKGYCNHFATAATLIFRMAGIPARYVEGYVTTTKNYTTAKFEKGAYTLELTGADSHAWVEVYLEGFGWIPVEVTPGFTMQKTEKENELSGKIVTYEKNVGEVINALAIDTPVINNVSASSDLKNKPTLAEKKEGKAEAHNMVSYYSLLLVFSVVIFIIFVVHIRRKWLVARREKKFRSDAINTNVLYIYDYLRDLFRYMKIADFETISELEYAKEMEKRCDFILTNELVVQTNIFLRATYSSSGVTTEEYKIILNFAYALQTKKYNTLALWQRLIFKYVYVM